MVNTQVRVDILFFIHSFVCLLIFLPATKNTVLQLKHNAGDTGNTNINTALYTQTADACQSTVSVPCPDAFLFLLTLIYDDTCVWHFFYD